MKSACNPLVKFQIPDWLEDCRLPDELSETAWKNTPAKSRAALKTALALQHYLFAGMPGMEKNEKADFHAGFSHVKNTRSASWALIVFDEAYNAPARICAAAAAAILGDVDTILAICNGRSPRENILLGLELCGIEDIFCLDFDGFGLLLRELDKQYGIYPAPGRAVFLHEGDLDLYVNLTREIDIHYYEEFRKPNLLLKNPDSFSKELLLFAQGFVPPQIRSGRIDCIYSDNSEDADKAPLIITPGLEGFWLHPGLSPEFFKITGNIFKVL